jgi:hypothetical protein
MQTDQVIWLVAGGIAVLILLFVIRLFRMPQGDRLAFPSTAAEQGPTQLPNVTRIRSKKDLIAFLQQETGDQELALLLADVAERIGKDGCIDVRQGGSGNPYAVEYAERVGELDRLKEALKGATSDDERDRLERQIAWLAGLDQRSCGEIRAELARLKEALKTTTSDDEGDRLERQIALLAGDVCTFWINVMLTADYERQRRLIKETFRKLKSAVAR